MAPFVTLPVRESQLELLLADERWCRNYLASLRWPDGFTCGYCGNHNEKSGEQEQFNCCFCGRRCSITAGTVLHGTKKSVSLWLRYAWMICSTVCRPTIREIQNKLSLRNYQTARIMFHKLNHAYRYGRKCHGVVEIDGFEILINTKQTHSNGCILAALEISSVNNMTGKLYIEYYNTFSTESLTHFLHMCVNRNSTLLLPDRFPFKSLLTGDYHALVETGESRHEKTSHLLVSCLNFCSKQQKKIASLKRLNADIDLFCFQINRTRFPDKITLFEDFVATILRQSPLSLVSRSQSFAGSGSSV